MEGSEYTVCCEGLSACRLRALIEAGLAAEQGCGGSKAACISKVVVVQGDDETPTGQQHRNSSTSTLGAGQGFPLVIKAASKRRKSPRGHTQHRERSGSPGRPGSNCVTRCRTPSPQHLMQQQQQQQTAARLVPPRSDASATPPPAPAQASGAAAGASEGQLESKIALLTMAVERYRRELRRRDARITELEKVAAEGQATVTSFHAQQRALFDKFCTLRQKYDGVKAHLREVLWDYIPSCRIPAVEGRGPAWLEAIPEVDRSLAEDKDRVGPYLLGEVLGEGQFAAVRGVRMRDGAGAARQLAVKMIDKSGVVNVTTLRRVDNEIASLQRLDHPGIMRLYDVVHAPQCIYMITDKAGQDLFEFFDAHLDGVSEAVAAQLLAKIMDPVAYCHAQGICHRDLKPENILFAEKGAFTAASRVLLCDFGLCARVETDAEEAALRRAHAAPRALHEFCGSPGFFAPEMLVRGAYDGKKADAWSLGCILLELVLGHEDFCRLWMGAYEYTNLKSAKAFDEAIQAASRNLQAELPGRLSPDLAAFLLTALHLDARKRLSVADMLRHPWILRHAAAAAAALPPPPPSSQEQHQRSAHAHMLAQQPRRDLTIDVPECNQERTERGDASAVSAVTADDGGGGGGACDATPCDLVVDSDDACPCTPPCDEDDGDDDDQLDEPSPQAVSPPYAAQEAALSAAQSLSMSHRARQLLPHGFHQPPDAPTTPSVGAMRDQFIHPGDALAHRLASGGPCTAPNTSSPATSTSPGSYAPSPLGMSPTVSPVNSPLRAFFKGRR